MKLHDLVLCLDCDEVYEAKGANPACPYCASSTYYPIASWLQKPVMPLMVEATLAKMEHIRDRRNRRLLAAPRERAKA